MYVRSRVLLYIFAFYLGVCSFVQSPIKVHYKPSCLYFSQDLEATQTTFYTCCCFSFGHICNIHSFLPSTLDSAYVLWKNRGLSYFSDLLIGVFATFSDLAEKFSIPQSNLFCFFQVCNFVCSLCPSFPDLL